MKHGNVQKKYNPKSAIKIRTKICNNWLFQVALIFRPKVGFTSKLALHWQHRLANLWVVSIPAIWSKALCNIENK